MNTTTTTLNDAATSIGKEVTDLTLMVTTNSVPEGASLEELRARLEERKKALQDVNEAIALTSVASRMSGSAVAGPSQNVVPANLPFFQWENFVWDSNKFVFSDVGRALHQFEVVLNSRNMDIDVEWVRLLPLCLPDDISIWLDEFNKKNDGVSVSWLVLKEAMVDRYGEIKGQVRFACIEEFWACRKMNSEHINVFIARFKHLLARAELTDKYLIAMVFYKAFSADDARVLSMAMSRADEKSFYDLEYIATKARRMKETVVKRLGGNTAVASSGSGSGSRKRNAGSSSIPVSAEAKKSKWYEPSSVSGPGNAGANASPWRSRLCNSIVRMGGSSGSSGSSSTKVLRAMTRRPKLNEVVNQVLDSEVGARALQARAAGIRAPGVVRPPWSAPVASSTSGSSGAVAQNVNTEEVGSGTLVAGSSSSLSSAEELGAVEVDTDTVMSESTDADGKEELGAAAQETLVDGIDHISVGDADMLQNMAAQQCKFDAVFSAPPSMRSNSICVPIVVQNVVCFCIVDTGATFSCITNEFFAYLGGNSLSGFAVAAADSVVQLGHEVSTVL